MRLCTWARTLIVAVVASTSLTTTAQAITLDPADTLGEVFSKFRSEMSALIAQAGGEARTTLTHAFAQTDQLISTLETTYANSLELTFKDLDDQQKKLFSDTNAMLDEIERKAGKKADETLQLGTDFNAVIADIATIWTDKPLVTSYEPLYVAPKSAHQNSVTISVHGNRLNPGTGEPRLSILGKAYPPVGIDDTRISFDVERNQIPDSGNVTAEVTLYQSPSGWRGWWPWSEYDKITYRLLLNVLPDALGSFASEKVLVKEVPETKPWSSPTLTAEKNGGGTDTKRDCYEPEGGFEFVVNSARPVEVAKTAYKDDDTSPGTNVGSVSIDSDFKTKSKICLIVTASTGCTECGGTTTGRLDVTMVKTNKVDVIVPGEPTMLDWTKDEEVTLDAFAKSRTLKVTLFDGIERRLPADQPFSLPFLKIDPSRSGTSVFLRPERPWVE